MEITIFKLLGTVQSPKFHRTNKYGTPGTVKLEWHWGEFPIQGRRNIIMELLTSLASRGGS